MQTTNLNRADLNLLVVFDAVARTRSVTAAADELALSQPAVSHALARLRRLARDPLFLRNRDGLLLTPRAVAWLPEVSRVLAAVATMLEDDRFDPMSSRRTFRIGASDYAMVTIAAPFLRRMRRTAPGVSVNIHHVDIDPYARLSSGDLDLAFVGVTAPRSPFAGVELFRETLVGLVCSNHPIAGKRRVTLEAYLAHPHMIASYKGSLHSPVDVRLRAAGRRRKVALTVPSLLASVGMLKDTDLIMSLPSRLAAEMPRDGLHIFRLPIAIERYPYYMIWHSRASGDAALSWVREQILTSIGGAAAESGHQP